MLKEKIKNENFITLQGWMVNELGLKGNELIVFALIYGFSQDQKSEFQGSYEYIANWLQTSRRTAINIVNKLFKKGFVIKTESCEKGKTNFYQYNKTLVDELIITSEKNSSVKKIHQCKNFTTTSEKISLDQCKNFTSTSEKISPNNNIINIDNNNNNKGAKAPIEEKKLSETSKLTKLNFKKICEEQNVPEEIRGAFEEFYEMRNMIKKPLTINGFRRICHKLAEMSNDTNELMKILNQSTDHCWQDVYELNSRR